MLECDEVSNSCIDKSVYLCICHRFCNTLLKNILLNCCRRRVYAALVNGETFLCISPQKLDLVKIWQMDVGSGKSVEFSTELLHWFQLVALKTRIFVYYIMHSGHFPFAIFHRPLQKHMNHCAHERLEAEF